MLTVTRARVEGEEAAAELRQEMLAAVAHAGARRVVVDMRHTLYVSSAAFWPLLALRAELRRSGGRLVICGLSPAVGDIFHTTRMVSNDGSFRAPFEMAPDRAEAVARLAAGGGEGPTRSP